MVNVDRCLKLLNAPQERALGKRKATIELMSKKEWPDEGEVNFEFVNLRYRPNTEIVLKDLTFQVKPGEKVGVVGRTGAGKSTLCLALSRIVEVESGTIRIDGIDIARLPIKEVRKRITVIPQDPLFSQAL
jgi:ABC-type multidrug transport system fused ATPase/permease subunit